MQFSHSPLRKGGRGDFCRPSLTANPPVSPFDKGERREDFAKGGEYAVHACLVPDGPAYGIIVACRPGEEHAVGDGHTARAIGVALCVKETMWAHGILALQWHASKIRACCVAAGVSWTISSCQVSYTQRWCV